MGGRAGDGIFAAQRIGEPLPDLDEQLVTGGVSQTVIVELELVHINKEDGELVIGVALGQVHYMLQAVEEKRTIWQVGEAIVKSIVDEHLLGAFAFGDITVNDDQFFGLAFGVADGAGGGFQDSPGTIFVADAVFQRLSPAGKTSLFRRLQHARAVVRMNLLKARGLLQLLSGIAQYLLISGAVVETAAVAVHQGDHVSGVLADQSKQLIVLGQLTPDAVQLEVLVNGINVEQEHQCGQAPHPFLQIAPIVFPGEVEPRESKGNNGERQQQGDGYGKTPQPPFAAFNLAQLNGGAVPGRGQRPR